VIGWVGSRVGWQLGYINGLSIGWWGAWGLNFAPKKKVHQRSTTSTILFHPLYNDVVKSWMRLDCAAGLF
jgi:hypothetical protein